MCENPFIGKVPILEHDNLYLDIIYLYLTMG